MSPMLIQHISHLEAMKKYPSTSGQSVEDEIEKDDFFYYCQKRPTFDKSLKKFGDRVYEAELEGIITIQNGIVRLS